MANPANLLATGMRFHQTGDVRQWGLCQDRSITLWGLKTVNGTHGAMVPRYHEKG